MITIETTQTKRSNPDHAILASGEHLDVKRSETTKRWGVYSRRAESFVSGTMVGSRRLAREKLVEIAGE